MTQVPDPSSDITTKERSRYVLTRWLYLRLLGLVYFTAFHSFSGQIIGLNGDKGILPASALMHQISDSYGSMACLAFPTVTWINCSDAFLFGITVCGVILSLLVILGIATAPSVMILGILYLSLDTICGEFSGFQSDGLLVEASALTLFLVPWNLLEPHWRGPSRLTRQTPPAPASIWLLRFLLFRLMFASGVVKLLSGDPTWANLTAMSYHYETQPIPTLLAWYAAHLPLWVHKTAVVFTFICELGAPCLIFAPRLFRFAAAATIVALQAMIALTGNYTFLNYLTIVLCVPLLDDQLLIRLLPASVSKRITDGTSERKKPRWERIIVTALAALVFSLDGFQLIRPLLGRAVVPAPVLEALSYAGEYRLVNSYGMFAVMTTSRSEIDFEGSNDGKEWLPYEFEVKPGANLKRIPGWIAPYTPRLDWRLWFAAMAPVQSSPWVISFVQKLLEGSPEVLKLLEHNPFPDAPPKYIRAFVYDYHFTNVAEHRATGDWWRRDNKRVYLPPLSLDKLHALESEGN
jgi:lipase maturation factor 1